MKNITIRKQILGAFILVFLAIALFVALRLVSQRQEIRKKAAGSLATLSFYPVKDSFQLNETKVFELKAVFTGGSAAEKIDYLKTEIQFSKDYLVIPSGKYVDTSKTGFDKIFRVDGPEVSNSVGKTIIEIGSGVSGSGPSTDKPITLARIYYSGKAETQTPQDVKIGTTQLVNNQSASIPVTLQGFSYTVGESSNITPTDVSVTSTPTPTGTTVTPTPTGITVTPTPTNTPATPTPTIPVVSCINNPTVDPFNQNIIDQNKWQIWNSTNGQVSPDSNGLHTAITNGSSGYAGVLTQNGVCGDYDISVDFSGFTTSNVSEADARLSLEDLDTNSTIFVERYSLNNEQGFWNRVVVNGEEQRYLTVQKPTTATAGKLRIRRIGDVFTTYYDTGAGWQKLGEFNLTFRRNAKVGVLIKSWNQNPVVSATFKNFLITEPIMDITVTPPISPSINPSIVSPSITSIVTPPSGRDQYVIDVGDKQWLSINIGPAITPQIRFKVKIARVFNTPDLYFRLRVKDDLAFTTNGNQNTTDSCTNPPEGTTDYYIPVKADGSGVYSPVPQNNATAPVGKKIASVSSDGWVFLDGIAPGKYYSLYLKGPKTVGSRMVQHIVLQPNQISPAQDFDWTVTPLQAGDLPDPNNNGQQDCTVNSVDMSLIQGLLGKTDAASLDIADVNYDGVVQGSDLASIVITLSSKPDDDN